MYLRLAVLLLLGAATSPVAFAEDSDDRARELYDNGVVLYDEGRYEDAIIAWEEAYRLSERALVLYNVANAEERLGNYQQALDHLNRYRAYATADERETLDRRISNLERRLAQQASAPPAAPATGPSLVPPPAPIASSTAPMPAPAPVRRQVRAAPLVLYTIGGIGLLTGGTFGTMAWSARNEAGDLCVPSGNANWCPANAANAIDRDRTMSVVADVGYAVGIGGALGGTLALLVPRDRDRMEVTVLHERQGAAVRVTRRF